MRRIKIKFRHTHTHTHTHTQTHIYTRTNVESGKHTNFRPLPRSISLYVCMYVFRYVCTYVHMYVRSMYICVFNDKKKEYLNFLFFSLSLFLSTSTFSR